MNSVISQSNCYLFFKSNEQFDDESRQSDLSGSSLVNSSCRGDAPKWTNKRAKKARISCEAVVDSSLYRQRATFENCRSDGDVCAILLSYQTICRRNGANIALSC